MLVWIHSAHGFSTMTTLYNNMHFDILEYGHQALTASLQYQSRLERILLVVYRLHCKFDRFGDIIIVQSSVSRSRAPQATDH